MTSFDNRSGNAIASFVSPRVALFGLALALPFALPLAARGLSAGQARVSEAKFSLTLQGDVPGVAPRALCSARIVEGSSELALFCRHDLGSRGEVTLVRAGTGARSESPFWSAPLASPFEAVASLSEEAMAALLSGELVLRLDTGAAGVVAEGGVGTPIFDSGFDEFSLCEWSNFPCPSDGNVCTNEVCSSTGVCSHPPNAVPCPLPNATGGCFLGGCVISSCNSGYSHCDTSNANGCEVNHNAVSGSCGNEVFVGEHGGDVACGVGCSDFVLGEYFANRTGRAEGWFEARAVENSSCSANVRHFVGLTVPSGVDWDLYVYRGCVLVGSSKKATGIDEVVEIVEIESAGSDDSFLYQVEVRWFSGRSCEEWSLDFQGTNC